jgi:hypothetical protein
MAKKEIKTRAKAPKRRGAPLGNKFAVGNRGGRPIVWTDELIEIERLALEEWIDNPENYYVGSFIVERGLTGYEMLERFAEKSNEFRETLKKARSAQEQRLVTLAVTKKGDGNFIKFVLANKAGWREKQEISGDASNPLSIILDRIGKSAKDPLSD